MLQQKDPNFRAASLRVVAMLFVAQTPPRRIISLFGDDVLLELESDLPPAGSQILYKLCGDVLKTLTVHCLSGVFYFCQLRF